MNEWPYAAFPFLAFSKSASLPQDLNDRAGLEIAASDTLRVDTVDRRGESGVGHGPDCAAAFVLDWNTPSIRFYRKLGATLRKEWILTRLTGPALRRLARTPRR
jgi:hypothetical protein